MLSLKLQWQQMRVKLGLTRDVVIAMFKNALPATAALWIIQSAKLGQEFDTVGFLPIIVTILLGPSMPRIPYLRLLSFTLLLNCFMLCVTLLVGYCSTQARLHTTPAGASLGDYNSSASAVCAVWLIFVTWALQTYRTYNPHRARSVVICTIFTEVNIITSATLSDMTSVISFNLQLFEMFLLGYAFSTFTNLFIFPMSSQDVTLADITKMLDLAKKATSSQKPFGTLTSSGSGESPETVAGEHVAAMSRAFAKFQIDISDAKKDVGWSRFSTSDFKAITHPFRLLITPMRGLFAVESIRTTLHFGTYPSQSDRETALEDATSKESREHWDQVFENLQQPMSHLRQLTEDAVSHCRISLHLRDSAGESAKVDAIATKADDPESKQVSRDLPGGQNFVVAFEKRIDEQRSALRRILVQLKEDDGGTGTTESSDMDRHRSPSASKGRLLFTLYIEHLYNGVLEALLQLVLFCDTKFTTSKKRLQLPGKKRFLKLLRRLIDHHHVEGDLDEITSEIPKLTPQKSRMQESPLDEPNKLGLSSGLRGLHDYSDKLFQVLSSSQSFFGLRVACAIMSIAIVGFLGQTQQWFFNRRGLWAAIFIPFSMAPSSGEAKSLLLFRVLGSILSIVVALINWYIVDGVPAGVIVMYFVLCFMQQYFLIAHPRWGSFWRPCLITHSVIVGYSLQARYSNIPQPPATTTDSFPIYLIGPYRCICTIVGVAVAYFWTVFPAPTTSNMIMRRRLGQALFILAEYHCCMHWAVDSWAAGYQGDVSDKKSVAYRLMKIRHRLFVKETATLSVIRDQHRFATFDVSLGGSYAEHRYVTIADEIDRIMSYLNAVIFVSAHFDSHIRRTTTSTSEKGTGPWESGAIDLMTAAKATSRQLISLIHILASAVMNDQPLPPFLESPEPFGVARALNKMRPDLMDVRHANEEGFKAFAVIEVSVAMMTKSLDRILLLVRELVGEIGVDIDHVC